ncbi:hypothetical protein QKU48_gp1283 [Fadolivirus algeromassiliense]|jgi:hypothetical protein|uniref:Uncharacterized protein n=1 Tax=Fadolivirus FV1/VV64 TaxID=3070911 RepID=A0A7D3R210_9VIRU|nr:hypothetical protein QKU48_gp1283 [Fadolivirus algeromassiliense]QKF94741.1 hypothetical protein Fadolivirus_1_1283 [Fadolivirus FV1/VV64]
MDEFGHIRLSSTDFKSTKFVEDMLERNHNVFAIGVAVETEIDYDSYNRYNGLFDESRILWAQCSHIDTLREDSKNNPGFHCGDCIKVATSCHRCCAEGLYMSGMDTIDEWNELRKELNIISNSEDESIIHLLEIILSTDFYWRIWRKLNYPYGEDKQKDLQTLENEFKQIDSNYDRNGYSNIHTLLSLKNRYNRWNLYTDEEKKKFHERALRFRQYFEVRPVVEGIPWW